MVVCKTISGICGGMADIIMLLDVFLKSAAWIDYIVLK